jgi:hypothetical protein
LREPVDEPQWKPERFAPIATDCRPISFDQIEENRTCPDNRNCTILDDCGRLKLFF